MRYYLITANRGHCGCSRGSTVKFAFEASSLLEACDKAKQMPGVKHTRMVLSGYEITREEYIHYRQVSAYARANGGMLRKG